jgi:Tfp pilus assembly protein PilV
MKTTLNAERRTLNEKPEAGIFPSLGTPASSEPCRTGEGKGGGRSSFIVHRSAFPRAFSFIEIMFAVIILGIGFIMVAALFPVAIQQTQASSQDVTASAFAQSISQSLSSTVSSVDLPPTGQSATAGLAPIYMSFGLTQAYGSSALSPAVPASTLGPSPFTSNPVLAANWTLWSKISGSLISSTDPRYGWVGFYSRDENTAAPTPIPNSYVNVVAIITQNQNPQASGYNANDLVQAGNTQPATLQGWPVQVQIIDSSFTGSGAPPGMVQDIAYVQGANANALASGAYIIISQDNCTGVFLGHFNGKIFRVGNRRTDLEPSGGAYQAWELQPGNDYTPDATTSATYTQIIPNGNTPGTFGGANAFVVGRMLNTPSAAYAPTGSPPNDFVGGSQAIAAYSFTIAVQ